VTCDAHGASHEWPGAEMNVWGEGGRSWAPVARWPVPECTFRANPCLNLPALVSSRAGRFSVFARALFPESPVVSGA
jgi:hypothetical protein